MFTIELQNRGVNLALVILCFRCVIDVNSISLSKNGPCFEYINSTDTWKHQWYLYDDSGNGRVDMNVLPAWSNCYNGSGIVVAVVDDGVLPRNDYTLDENLSYSIDTGNTLSGDGTHGTEVSGIIGSNLNSTCGVGIAFKATLAAHQIISSHSHTTQEQAEVYNHFSRDIDIYSNSFTHYPTGTSIYPLQKEMLTALLNGAKKGRRGKGSIFVRSTGNGGGFFKDSCAFEGVLNNGYVIPVAGILRDLTKVPSGEGCSAILVSAFTKKPNDPINLIFTTEGRNSCTTDFARNSAAVPMVSGAIALALQANSQLTYRDMMHLLVISSNGSLPSSYYRKTNLEFNKNGAGFLVSYYFGFGLINIARLVELALTWKNVPELKACSGNVEALTSLSTVSIQFKGCQIDFLEHVHIHLILSSEYAGKLVSNLTSPLGTISKLTAGRPFDFRTKMDVVITSVHFWGEGSNGIWTLSFGLSDGGNTTGTIDLVDILLYGYSKNNAATNDTVDDMLHAFYQNKGHSPTTTEGVSTKYSVTKLGDLYTTKPGNSYLTKSRDSYPSKQGDGYTTQPGNNYLTTSRDSYITKAGDSHTTKSRHRFPTKSGVNNLSVTTAHHSIKNVIKSEGTNNSPSKGSPPTWLIVFIVLFFVVIVVAVFTIIACKMKKHGRIFSSKASSSEESHWEEDKNSQQKTVSALQRIGKICSCFSSKKSCYEQHPM